MQDNIKCHLMAEFLGKKNLYRIKCPDNLKKIKRGYYYMASIVDEKDDKKMDVIINAPPLQKSIDYTVDIDDLYFLIDEAFYNVRELKSLKSVTILGILPDEERCKIQAELKPITSNT